jgi:hypothetical protein
MAGPNQGNFLTMLQQSGLTEVERTDLLQKLESKQQIEGVYTWPAGLMEAYNLAVQEREQEDQQQAQALAGTQTANVIYDQPPAAPPQDPGTPATSAVTTVGDPPTGDPPAGDPPGDPPVDPSSDPPQDDPSSDPPPDDPADEPPSTEN